MAKSCGATQPGADRLSYPLFEGGRKGAEEMKKVALIVSVTMFPAICFAQIFGPSNYEDCVLKGLKDAQTDSAVMSVHSMCRSKFPQRPLTEANKIPDPCLLYWDGLRTTKLTSEPRNWREKFQKFKISVHEMPFAYVFVPKSYEETPLSQRQLYEQASLWCR